MVKVVASASSLGRCDDACRVFDMTVDAAWLGKSASFPLGLLKTCSSPRFVIVANGEVAVLPPARVTSSFGRARRLFSALASLFQRNPITRASLIGEGHLLRRRDAF